MYFGVEEMFLIFLIFLGCMDCFLNIYTQYIYIIYTYNIIDILFILLFYIPSFCFFRWSSIQSISWARRWSTDGKAKTETHSDYVYIGPAQGIRTSISRNALSGHLHERRDSHENRLDWSESTGKSIVRLYYICYHLKALSGSLRNCICFFISEYHSIRQEKLFFKLIYYLVDTAFLYTKQW